MWPCETHPMFLSESSYMYTKFKACTSILFSGKSNTLAFFDTKKGCCHIDKNVPLVTPILNIYVWVCRSNLNRSSVN